MGLDATSVVELTWFQLSYLFFSGIYRILAAFDVFMYWKDPTLVRRYESHGRVFPVHEHRKTRLISNLKRRVEERVCSENKCVDQLFFTCRNVGFSHKTAQLRKVQIWDIV